MIPPCREAETADTPTFSRDTCPVCHDDVTTERQTDKLGRPVPGVWVTACACGWVRVDDRDDDYRMQEQEEVDQCRGA